MDEPVRPMDMPPGPLPDAVLAVACERLAARLGLHFPPERWPDLLRRAAAAAPELGCADGPACLHKLAAGELGPRELEALARHLTVGETYFFRDPEIFAALREQLLPELIRQRRDATRRLRIWSAGCSSGEEAYSIAMTVAEQLPDLDRWNVSVLATDINLQALARGREGIYDNWSFRAPLPPLAQRWFGALPGGRRAVLPRIKSLVDFAYLNLTEAVYPALETRTNAMDIVFCRNVLMYFHPQRMREVLARLADCLLEGGWLVLSPVENSLVSHPSLAPCRLPGLVAYRKVAEGAARAEPDFPAALPAFCPLPGPTEADSRFAAEPLAASEPPTPEAVTQASPTEASDTEIMIRRARELAGRGALSEALGWCERAIARDKLNPVWAYLRASVLLELGDGEGAAAALRRSLYLDPRFVMAHFALASLLLGQGRTGAAHRHYRNVLELLAGEAPEQILPESDGMAAGRLRDVAAAILADDAATEAAA